MEFVKYFTHKAVNKFNTQQYDYVPSPPHTTLFIEPYEEHIVNVVAAVLWRFYVVVR